MLFLISIGFAILALGGISSALSMIVKDKLAIGASPYLDEVGETHGSDSVVWLTVSGRSVCADPEQVVRVGPGPFWMGSDKAERRLAYALSSETVREAQWFEAERPRHRVVLPAFCIDRVLVTQAQYALFMAATGHRPPGISKEEYQRQGFLVHDYDREVTRSLWRNRTPPAGLEDHPVVLVSAEDAAAYCRWRHAGGRLPTEAEWEKAARGDDGRIFPWGSHWDPERLNSAARGPGGTTPVNQYPGGISPYGVFDPVGNVFQWTSSALPDGRTILKGCAWDDEPGLCRPAFRHGRPPGSRHILIGFRCASPNVAGGQWH